MEWDVSWEIVSDGKNIGETGIVRVKGDHTIDALTAFFKSKDNRGRRLIGISAVYEKMEKRRKTL
jgi:hypothetical protein